MGERRVGGLDAVDDRVDLSRREEAVELVVVLVIVCREGAVRVVGREHDERGGELAGVREVVDHGGDALRQPFGAALPAVRQVDDVRGGAWGVGVGDVDVRFLVVGGAAVGLLVGDRVDGAVQLRGRGREGREHRQGALLVVLVGDRRGIPLRGRPVEGVGSQADSAQQGDGDSECRADQGCSADGRPQDSDVHRLCPVPFVLMAPTVVPISPSLLTGVGCSARTDEGAASCAASPRPTGGSPCGRGVRARVRHFLSFCAR